MPSASHGDLPSLPAPCAVVNRDAPAREALGTTVVTFHEYERCCAVVTDICDDSTAWIRQRQRFPLVSGFSIELHTRPTNRRTHPEFETTRRARCFFVCFCPVARSCSSEHVKGRVRVS